MKTFYSTTPIYYVNANPHIGAAYATAISNLIYRFYHLNARDAKFLTGTDEHGQKIEQAAVKEGKTPQRLVDEISDKFRELAKFMNYKLTHHDYIDDNFIRTTSPKHKVVVQDVWRKMVENGWLYEGMYTGWYCVSDEAYYSEDDLIKSECGKFKTDLGKDVEWREEKTYFFRLSEFQELLLDLYKWFPEIVQPEGKKSEAVAFLSGITMKDYDAGKSIKKGHVQDISVSRNSFDWGIRIPVDLKGNELLDKNGEWKADLKPDEKHVIYVWFDALFNYVSALGGIGSDEYNKYWYNGDTKIDIIGKEILRPHFIYWPAFLIAYRYTWDEVKNKKYDKAELKKILPTTVFAHGFIVKDGVKMSKSIGNVVNPYDEIEWMEKDFGIEKNTAIDYLKYYLINFTTLGNDADYSRANLIEKVNGDLANKIGNLAKRSLDMIHKNFDGIIPNVKDFDVIFENKREDFENCIGKFDLTGYMNLVLRNAEKTNKYMEDNAPWTLIKVGKIDDAKKVLYSTVNSLKNVILALQPFAPYLSSRILSEMNLSENETGLELMDKNIEFGLRIKTPTIVIPRLQEKR